MTTIASLAEAQDVAIDRRHAGFSQVPICRRGQWGVLRRTPSGEEFIPTPSREKALSIVASDEIC